MSRAAEQFEAGFNAWAETSWHARHCLRCQKLNPIILDGDLDVRGGIVPGRLSPRAYANVPAFDHLSRGGNRAHLIAGAKRCAVHREGRTSREETEAGMNKCEQDVRDFFVERYAENAGLSVSQLLEMGYRPVPCECGADDCLGWVMEGDMARLAWFMEENLAKLAEFREISRHAGWSIGTLGGVHLGRPHEPATLKKRPDVPPLLRVCAASLPRAARRSPPTATPLRPTAARQRSGKSSTPSAPRSLYSRRTRRLSALQESAYHGYTGTAWVDFVDPLDAYRDPSLRQCRWGRPPAWNAGTATTARSCWAEIDLDIMRSQARWLATTNLLATGCVESLADYTVRTGFKYEFRPRQRYSASPPPAGWPEIAEAVLEEFQSFDLSERGPGTATPGPTANGRPWPTASWTATCSSAPSTRATARAWSAPWRPSRSASR